MMNTLKIILNEKHTTTVILVSGLFFRAFNIDSLLPIVDETGHLWESLNYSMYAPLDRLLSGKYLGYLFYKPIYLLSWDPLYGARLFTAIISIVTAYYVYHITLLFCSHYAGVVAMCCYLISPFTYFHDRQAIFDPLASAFFAASLFYFISGFEKLTRVFFSGFIFFLGLTVKVYLLSGLIFFLPLCLSVKQFCFTNLKIQIIPAAKRVILAFIAGCFASLLTILIITPNPGYPVINLRKAGGQIFHFLLQRHGETRHLSDIPLGLLQVGYILLSEYFEYAGFVTAVFIALSLIYIITIKHYKLILLLSITLICLCSYGVLSYVFNRYTHFLQIPLSIFFGSTFVTAARRLNNTAHSFFSRSSLWALMITIESWVVILFICMAVSHAYVSVRIMHNPYYRIAKTDKYVYELGWPNATGIDEVAAVLKDLSLKSDKKIHVVTIGWGMHGVWTLPLKFRGGGYPVTFLHDWIHSEWQRENLRQIMKTSRVLFFLEHPVSFINQEELLKIGRRTESLYKYQKKDSQSSYELVEITE